MDDETARRTPKTHEVGMLLDAMSVEELEYRIGMLQDEIARLKAAITARKASRSDADALFKF